MSRSGKSLVLALLAYFCPSGVLLADDWPQLQHDAAHTGYTSDQPKPPFRVKWVRDLEEPTQTASQPIVAEGKLFVGTGYGNLYAVDCQNGKTLWRYQTQAPIFGSAAYDAGVVYVNSLDCCCHALSAQDGKPIWQYETSEPIWAAPVIAEGKVFVAGRDGFVYALDSKTGRLLWKTEVASPVLTTPAYLDGRLYVGVGDMHVYAFDVGTGNLAWKSPRIPGAAMREYWLVATSEVVIATSQVAYACHHIQEMIQQAVMNPFNERHKNDPVLVEDEIFPELVKWYEAHPQHKTVHVLDPNTGAEKFIAPVIGVNGGSCTSPPPAVSPDGWAYTMYSNVWLRASGWAFFGRFDLRTGKMDPLLKDRYAPKYAYPNEWHWQPKAGSSFTRRSTFDGGFSVSDQSWGVSLGGGMAFLVRDPSWVNNPPDYDYFDIQAGLDRYLLSDPFALREFSSYGKFGSAFHSTCSPMAISGRNIFHKSARSVLFAFEGAE